MNKTPKVTTTGYNPKNYTGCSMKCLNEAIFRIEPKNGGTEPHLYSCAQHLPKAVRQFPFNPCSVSEIHLTVRRQKEINKQKWS